MEWLEPLQILFYSYTALKGGAINAHSSILIFEDFGSFSLQTIGYHYEKEGA